MYSAYVFVGVCGDGGGGLGCVISQIECSGGGAVPVLS